MTNYTSEIQLFVEKNMLEPPDRSGVYLSQIPVEARASGAAKWYIRKYIFSKNVLKLGLFADRGKGP
jgi:hypothetical protein